MAALACPGAASALGKADRACLGAASAIKMAGLACSGFGQCAQRGCPSLLRCRQCAQRGFSSVLFEIAVRKSWSRLHCALSHCTLHCFAPCMYMHGSTLVYIYIGPIWVPISPKWDQIGAGLDQIGFPFGLHLDPMGSHWPQLSINYVWDFGEFGAGAS